MFAQAVTGFRIRSKLRARLRCGVDAALRYPLWLAVKARTAACQNCGRISPLPGESMFYLE